MEERVPWWRRAIEFALDGFRTGFGLFRRNGKVEPSVSSIAEVESDPEPETEGAAISTVSNPPVEAAGFERPDKFEEPEKESALRETSPQSEVAAAEVKPPAEAAENREGLSVPELTAEAVPNTEEMSDPAAEAAPKIEETPGAQAAAETEIPAEPVADEGANVTPVDTVTEGESAEDAAVENLAELAEPSQVSVSEPDAQASPEAAEQPATAEAQAEATPVIETAKTQEAAPVQETTGTLPFDAKPAPEKTTAEKVAAALKARGVDAEQSPFSVLVGQVYDGPLDLLLDLIRKQDIDIYDIPIARITAQFLAYVDQLKASDMDVAGEFIYTAALLIHIKSKMLLPRAPAGPDDAAEDPRRELVERLLEHERFKNAAQMLLEKQMVEAATWTNPGVREFKEDAGAEPEVAADTTDLVRVFRDILDRARNRPILSVEEETVTVGQMIQFLARRLTMEDKPVALRKLLTHTHSERALIAMFLALLELVRLQAILLRQDRHFSEIFIKKHAGFEAAMNQGLADARDDWR